VDGLFEQPSDATPPTPEEQRDLIPAHIAWRHELNEAEQENIVRAQDWAFARRRAGRFRKTERNLGIPFYEIPAALRQLLADTKAWIEYESYPSHQIALRFHHRLVQIHPFPNGNGPTRPADGRFARPKDRR
jgi:fido (protein-threonine AMPylation protein)